MSVMITTINPINLLTGQSKEILIGGYGFIGEVGVVLNNIFVPVFFNGANLIKFVLPYVPAGTYPLTVVNGDGTQFVYRPGIVISDPPVGTNPGDLGSAALPIVLPPVIVESSCNAVVNSSANNILYKTPASVYADPVSGNTTASKIIDSSTISVEPSGLDKINNLPSTGATISTQFGTFRN
jgi:hypothetical protein